MTHRFHLAVGILMLASMVLGGCGRLAHVRVLDGATKEPMVGVTVRALRQNYLAIWQSERLAVTDTDGLCKIRLPDWTADISVLDSDGRMWLAGAWRDGTYTLPPRHDGFVMVTARAEDDGDSIRIHLEIWDQAIGPPNSP